MPYIKKYKRKFFDGKMEELINYIKKQTYYHGFEPGYLNYIITRISMATFPNSYEDYNKIIGVLECVKYELYRRVISDYEDKKINENGDLAEFRNVAD